MTLNIDDNRIDLACPECGHKFNERIGRLKNDPTIPCPGCGTPIKIDADGLRKGMESVDKSLTDLQRQIGKLFK